MSDTTDTDVIRPGLVTLGGETIELAPIDAFRALDQELVGKLRTSRGTGFSSISHLHDLPIAGLKLDASFTQALANGNRRTQRLTQALAGLSLGLDLDTIAEGVEQEPEASLLWGQGWRRGQGYLFGRAEPVT